MQITLNLPDDLGQELKNLPSPELFVANLVKAALQQHKAQNQSLSKWARIAGRIEATSAGLGDYTQQFKQDMREAREDLVFKDSHEVSV